MSSPAPFDPSMNLRFSIPSSGSSASSAGSSSSSSSSSAAGASAGALAVAAESLAGDSKSTAESKAEKELSGADLKGKSEKDKILSSVNEICTHLKNDPKAILQQALKYFIDHVEEEGVSFAPRHGVQLMERVLILAKKSKDEHSELLSMLYLARIYASGSFDIMLDRERAKELYKNSLPLQPRQLAMPSGCSEIAFQLALICHDGLSGCFHFDLKERDKLLNLYKAKTGIDCSIIFKILDPETLPTGPLKELNEGQIAALSLLGEHQLCANILLTVDELIYKNLSQNERRVKIKNIVALAKKFQGKFNQIHINYVDFLCMYSGLIVSPSHFLENLQFEMMSLRKRLKIWNKLFSVLGRSEHQVGKYELMHTCVLNMYKLINVTLPPKYIDESFESVILVSYSSRVLWGMNCEPDYKTARKIFQKLSEKNNMWGKLHLAYCEETGLGGAKIPDPKHLTLYQEAIKGSDVSLRSIGHCFAGNYYRLRNDFHNMFGHLAYESVNGTQAAFELIRFYLTQGLSVHPKASALEAAESLIKRCYLKVQNRALNSVLLKLINLYEQVSGKKFALPAPETSLPSLPLPLCLVKGKELKAHPQAVVAAVAAVHPHLHYLKWTLMHLEKDREKRVNKNSQGYLRNVKSYKIKG